MFKTIARITALLVALLTVSGTPAQQSGYVIYSNVQTLSLSSASAASVNFVLDDTTPSTPVPITATTDQPWLTVTPNKGSTSHMTYVVVATVQAGMAGAYTGNVILTETGPNAGGYSDGNSPFKFPVTFTVTGPTKVKLTLTYGATSRVYMIAPQMILETEGASAGTDGITSGAPELQVCDTHKNCLHLAE